MARRVAKVAHYDWRIFQTGDRPTAMCMKQFIPFLILLLTTTFPACKEEAGVPSIPAEDAILPLTTNNSWNFLRRGIDSNGVTVDSSLLSMTVGQPDTLGTEEAYPVSNFPFVFIDPGPLLWANRTGGLYNVIPGPTPPSRAFVRVFQYPTAMCDSLRFSGHTIVTASVTEMVTVPAGSFRCVRYDIFQSGTLRGQLFVAPNVGIVKSWQRYFGLSALVDELWTFQVR